jgi:hypothetical protein
VTKARLHCTQEETEQATEDLKKVQEVVIEKRLVALQEKDALQTNFEEEKEQLQQEKD